MGFLDFVSTAVSGVSTLLGEIVRFLIALLNLLVRIFAFLWNVLLAVLRYALKAFTAVGKFFAHVWENGLKPLFGKIGEIIKTAHKWLETHLRPIIDWLRRAQRWMELHVWRPLRRYINFLQRIRRWLAILRLLHIRWAEALDRRIARTEAQLAHTYLVLRGILNQVITWVNVASDPVRLGRMVLVGVIGRRSAAAIVRILTGLPIGVFFPTLGKGTHLYEHPLVSTRDVNDPRRNPPASSILLSLSPLPTEGFEDVDPTPSDAEIDTLEGLGYFDDLRAGMFAAGALFDAMDSPRISITDTMVERKGNLSDAGLIIGKWLKTVEV